MDTYIESILAFLLTLLALVIMVGVCVAAVALWWLFQDYREERMRERLKREKRTAEL